MLLPCGLLQCGQLCTCCLQPSLLHWLILPVFCLERFRPGPVSWAFPDYAWVTRDISRKAESTDSNLVTLSYFSIPWLGIIFWTGCPKRFLNPLNGMRYCRQALNFYSLNLDEKFMQTFCVLQLLYFHKRDFLHNLSINLSFPDITTFWYLELYL